MTNLDSTNTEHRTFLPICSFCKAIKPNRNTNLWLKPDDETDFKLYTLYMENPDRAILSHGICPECYEKHYGKHQ